MMLNEVRKPMLEKGLSLEVTQAAKEWLGEKGFDPTFGARPLRRLIEREMEDTLSEGVIRGDYRPGQTVVVDVDNEDEENPKLAISVQTDETPELAEAGAAPAAD
ncbi:MAG: hypothetical protein F4Y96_04345 [Chloroflexi bacterium]|nr:hypothetical protein [Chloroflexota bacterium]